MHRTHPLTQRRVSPGVHALPALLWRIAAGRVLVAATCALAVACAKPDMTQAAAGMTTVTPAAARTNGAALSLTDDEGRPIRFAAPFHRIVSLYAVHTENLLAIGAGDQLIGIAPTTESPAGLAHLPRLRYTGDPEYVIALHPDLVLIRPFIRRQNPAYIAVLEQAGIPVVSLYPADLGAFDSYIRNLGLLTGRTAQAEARLAAFHTALDEIAQRAEAVSPKKRVFFEATATEVRTVTPDSLPGRAIRCAGGINVAASAKALRPGSSIAPFGAERVLALADTIDLYVVQQGPMDPARSIADLAARPGFGALRAIREGRVCFIEERLISAPTFRYPEAVAALMDALYPTRDPEQ